MSRGRYPRRINLSGIDQASLERYLLLWDPADLHSNPESFPVLDANTLFGKGAPLSLDIGCGTGEFLCELARRHPEEAFLGLDRGYKPIVRAASSASRLDLDNILFVRADIRQAMGRMADESFKMVYLQFPVPGPAGRAFKPGFFGDRFVQEVGRVLEPGGRLSVVTDQEGAFRVMECVMAEAGNFRLLDPDEFVFEIDPGLRSHNYQIWTVRGHNPYRLEAVKIEP